MADLFKDIFNESFFDTLTSTLEEVKQDFNTTGFLQDIYDTKWDAREFKQRMRHIAQTLHLHLSKNFPKDIELIRETIANLKSKGVEEASVEFMFFPDYIELYGLEYFDLAVEAFAEITSYTSCEFAVRPFILQYPDAMLSTMLEWTQSEDEHIRRLASEGCRPRLPWAMALPFLKKDPAPILPILENLKTDKSEYVRRSVANNLNDIAKDNPEITIRKVKAWQGISTETDWLIKHASRTLLKQGNSEILQVFGFSPPESLEVSDFRIHTPEVKIGESLAFSFILKNITESEAKVRLEYGIYFMKANGKLSRKVFVISEKVYTPGASANIERKQAFKIITTRKLYPGLHQVALIINGEEQKKYDFHLLG